MTAAHRRVGLMLVDVQRDFLARPGLVPDAATLVRAVAALLQQARSRQWPVFHVQTRVGSDGSDWMPHWRKAGRADCIDGTPGGEPPPELQPRPGETLVHKTHFNAFDNPALLPALHTARVEQLIVTGIHTHACVREAVIGAYSRGFEVLVPTDAIGSYDPVHADLTLKWLHGRAAECMSSEEILRR